MIDLKKKLDREWPFGKFSGVSPEGFILVHEETLTQLKNFDVWILWSEGKLDINELNKQNFDKFN